MATVHPAENCVDSDCLLHPTEQKDLCRCGDYRDQHEWLTWRCGVCADQLHPMGGCKRFRKAG